jgi:hypothetical protein
LSRTDGSRSQPDVDAAILRTLLYADVFDYPMTADEVHHYLIGLALPREQVRRALEGSPWLADRTERVNGYFAARGRAESAAVREQRARASLELWAIARRYARWLGYLPFVRMVAVTGALAMHNSEAGDDIDFLIVTAPGRVWLTRALCVGMVKAARRLGARLCPNYVLAESALEQERQDLFIAHEVAQMTPVVGHALYQRMRQANAWALRFLPNATGPLHREPEAAPRGLRLALQRLLEWLLGGRLGDWLEQWERRRKVEKFRAQAQAPTAHAVLDAEHVKGHFVDYGRWTIASYEERLQVFGVARDGFSSASPAEPHRLGAPAGSRG